MHNAKRALINHLFKLCRRDKATQNTLRTNLLRLVGLPLLFALTSFTAQAALSADCGTAFAERLSWSAGTQGFAGGTSIGTSAVRTMHLMTALDYDYLDASRIGRGDTKDFTLNYELSGTVLYGAYKRIQIYGNYPIHESRSTESELWIDLVDAKIWSRSITWGGIWKQWTNVLCYENVFPGSSAVVVTAHIPSVHGDKLITLRVEIGAERS